MYDVKLHPKNIIEKMDLIKMILEYSDKKINANPPLLYSTLNPETNSDSPSAKSNGDRLVSANLDESQHIPNGKDKKINQIFFWKYKKSIKLYLSIKRINDKIIIAKLTSYEIVWATDRSPPSKE